MVPQTPLNSRKYHLWSPNLSQLQSSLSTIIFNLVPTPKFFVATLQGGFKLYILHLKTLTFISFSSRSITKSVNLWIIIFTTSIEVRSKYIRISFWFLGFEYLQFMPPLQCCFRFVQDSRCRRYMESKKILTKTNRRKYWSCWSIVNIETYCLSKTCELNVVICYGRGTRSFSLYFLFRCCIKKLQQIRLPLDLFLLVLDII